MLTPLPYHNHQTENSNPQASSALRPIKGSVRLCFYYLMCVEKGEAYIKRRYEIRKESDEICTRKWQENLEQVDKDRAELIH